MPMLTEDLAGRYATDVYQILAAEFPRLKTRTMERIFLELVGRNAELPSMNFELCVDEPAVAIWRLVPDHAGPDRWRVQLSCSRRRPRWEERACQERVNEALRAIPHPYPDAKEA